MLSSVEGFSWMRCEKKCVSSWTTFHQGRERARGGCCGGGERKGGHNAPKALGWVQNSVGDGVSFPSRQRTLPLWVVAYGIYLSVYLSVSRFVY